ncbi:MAG: N-methyl-L-tryptophan oxidase [Pararhizobium sp.]
MTTAAEYDVAVIGLGAMGTSAVHHLAARGARVVGIERFGPAHSRGSSHGDSRIIRLGYFEDPAYVPLLKRAYENWRALEAETGAGILNVTGVLQIGRPEAPVVKGSLAACELYDLDHEVLDRDAMAARYPQFHLDRDELAVLDPAGGILYPEIAVLAMQRAAAARGTALRFGEKVTAIEPGDGGVTVMTANGRVRARKAIVATGSWIADLVPRLRGVANPIRQVVGWFAPCGGFDVSPRAMPAYLRDVGDGSYFGFPLLGPDGLKFGRHAHFMEPVVPDEPNAPVNETDRMLLEGFRRDYLPAAGESRAYDTCRYTMLPGEDFLIDAMPGEPSIIVASPCSGHGFKFVSVVGEILADLALDGGTARPVSAFSFAALDRQIEKHAPPQAATANR